MHGLDMITLMQPIRIVDRCSHGAGLSKMALSKPVASYISKEAIIMGWGAAYDHFHGEPTRNLKYMKIETTECPTEYSGVWLRTPKETIPEFICAHAPPSTGGPCSGDEGGLPPDTQVL